MPNNKKADQTGLALSGGGFRATLFHLGTLIRLNELGYLPKLHRITSVSGGSIIAAYLGYKWKDLNFNDQGVSLNFEHIITNPVREFCRTFVDYPAVIRGWLNPFKRPADILASYYNTHLFHGATLADLPNDKEGKGPSFIIYATNLQTGSSVRLSKRYLSDYRVGLLPNPDILLSRAVAASSGFPPVMAPIILKTNPTKWDPQSAGKYFSEKSLRENLVLGDGGIYDNLGLQALKKYGTILISDAGKPFNDHKGSMWYRLSHLARTKRVLDIAMEQVHARRTEHVVEQFIQEIKKGTYWGISTNIDEYELTTSMVKNSVRTQKQQTVDTRLNKFPIETESELINWGYALADTAMRRYVLDTDPGAGQWPIDKYRLDR